MNKELRYLLLSREWPIVYESQLNRIPWLERKTKKRKKEQRKLKGGKTKEKQKETKLDTNSLNSEIYACDVFVLGSAWISKLLGVPQHLVTWVN